MEKEDKMKFTISARQTNSTNTADGYIDWQEVDEWDAENAETAIDQWMDNMRYVDDRFVQTGASSYRLDDIEFDVKADPSAQPEPCEDAVSRMDDLISRQAVIDAYGDWYVEEGTEDGFIGTVKQLLEG